MILDDARSIHGERYSAALRKRGMSVYVASLEKGDNVDIPLKGRVGVAGLDYLFAARQIADIVQNHNIDVIDAHSASGYGFTAAVSGAWKSRPLLLHCLGSDILISANKSAIHKARVRTALARAHVAYSDSEYMAEKIREIEPETSTQIKYWGAEQAIFDIFKMKQNYRFLDNSTIDIYIPRPQEDVYNNELIINALSGYVLDGRITLTFPNWGTRLDGFESLVRSKYNSAQVRLYNRVPRQKYAEFISAFDVYLSASKSDSSPASLIEAMAAGLFPVVGNIAGVSDWMDIKSGLMFDINDASTLKNAFDKLLSGQVEVANIIRHNHKKASELGHFDKTVDMTIKTMRDLIRGK